MVAAMVLTSLSCSPVVQSPPASESGIPRECALRNKNNTNQGKKKKGMWRNTLCPLAAGGAFLLVPCAK